jgi:hypothetical protein
MSYGQADKIAGRASGDPAPGAEKPVPAIDPTLYQRDDVRRILAALGIGSLYRILQDAGVNAITAATKLSSPSASATGFSRWLMSWTLAVAATTSDSPGWSGR